MLPPLLLLLLQYTLPPADLQRQWPRSHAAVAAGAAVAVSAAPAAAAPQESAAAVS
jgi:hypothetical protein